MEKIHQRFCIDREMKNIYPFKLIMNNVMNENIMLSDDVDGGGIRNDKMSLIR